MYRLEHDILHLTNFHFISLGSARRGLLLFTQENIVISQGNARRKLLLFTQEYIGKVTTYASSIRKRSLDPTETSIADNQSRFRHQACAPFQHSHEIFVPLVVVLNKFSILKGFADMPSTTFSAKPSTAPSTTSRTPRAGVHIADVYGPMDAQPRTTKTFKHPTTHSNKFPKLPPQYPGVC